MIAGPAETGKTFAALWLLDQRMRQYPRSRGAMVRKVRATMDGTVLETYATICEMHGNDVTPYGGQSPQWFTYPNGSRLYIGGMDSPGKVLSGERDFIYVNQAEELEDTDWQTLLTRATGRSARAPFAQLFGDCNPGPPTHWILHRSSLRLLESRHEDNPTLYDAAGNLTERGKRTMQVLDSLVGILYQRLRLGRWVAAEGTVYELDRSIHLIDPFPIPASWQCFRAIDFGYTNPFVCLWGATDEDKRLYIYRHIYMSGRTVAEHAKQIQQVERWYLPNGEPNPDRERIISTIADHDAEDRATLHSMRIPTLAARKDVSMGIQAVQTRLKVAGDGRPRLFIMRNSLIERDETLAHKRHPYALEQEFDVYVWPKNTEGRSIKEEPVKLYDHGLDALRYLVMHVDRAGRSLIR